MEEREQVELLWKYEKYNVLMHSEQKYLDIKGLMEHDPGLQEVRTAIHEALSLEPTKESIMNAFRHMWGYFKNIAENPEQTRFKDMMAAFEMGLINESELLKFIRKLADKYKVENLQESTVLNK